MGQKYFKQGTALALIKCDYCDNEAEVSIFVTGVGKRYSDSPYETNLMLCEKCLLVKFVDKLLHIYNDG